MSGGFLRGRAPKVLVPLAVVAASLLVATEPVAASVGYTSVVKLASTEAYTTSASAIARSASSTSSRLHVVYTSKKIDGVNDEDTGPYQGIYYRRSSAGSAWTTAKRLNSSSQHADYASVATSGSRVFVVWRTQTHIEDYEDTADPYVIRFRANDNQGSSTAWRSSIALTTFGRVDRTAIAASGSSVFVIYTERDGGEVRLLKSADNGVTWGSPTAVGATVDQPFGPGYGYVGNAVVAVTGATVVISYTSDDQIVTKVSTDGGDSFGAPELREAEFAGTSLTARSGRVALAYADPSGVYSRIWQGGGWLAWRKAASYPNSAYKAPTAYLRLSIDPPDVALYGTAGIGLAFGSCTTDPCDLNSGSRASLRWRQSGNNGATWGSVVSVASGKVTTSRGFNWGPSVVMSGSATRHFVWNGLSAIGSSFNKAPYVRTVNGIP
jgi:hypothetical protein